jgi:hypothetical protein
MFGVRKFHYIVVDSVNLTVLGKVHRITPNSAEPINNTVEISALRRDVSSYLLVSTTEESFLVYFDPLVVLAEEIVTLVPVALGDVARLLVLSLFLSLFGMTLIAKVHVLESEERTFVTFSE